MHTAAQFAWKNASVAVTISGTEMAKNSGPEALRDLLRAKIRNAENSMINGLAAAVYHIGTEHGGKTFGGLQHIVATDPTTGVVGGIDRSDAANTWWRNYQVDVVANFANATLIQGQMHTAWLSLVRSPDHPHVIVSNNTAYTAFNDSLLDIQRINQAQKGESGFSELVFHGPGGQAEVIFDPNCPADRQYFLNLNTIKLRVHSDRNMMVSKARESLNQDAQVTHIFYMGNMTSNNAGLNGVIWT